MDTAARLTAVLNLYHQTTDAEPVGVSHSAEYPIHSDEEPYKRRIKNINEIKSLDFGWLEDNYSHICIRNITGMNSQVQLSQEEKNKFPSVKITFAKDEDADGLIIPPGMFNFISPEIRDDIYVRSYGIGPAAIEIFILPE